MDYSIERTIVTEGYDGRFCWMHPHASIIPGAIPIYVLTMQKWLLERSDVFMPAETYISQDHGKSWRQMPDDKLPLGRKALSDGAEEALADFTPKWHRVSKTLLGIGTNTHYKADVPVSGHSRSPVWAIFNKETSTWDPWQPLILPREKEANFKTAGAGHSQRVDLENGDILLPIQCRANAGEPAKTCVVRCTFDGVQLRYASHGGFMTIPSGRGLYEPSLTRLKGRYYLTMRSDGDGYVSTSEDGVAFTQPVKWTFDDGKPLGSQSTQAHWVTHGGGLFLCYTRRDVDNADVFRFRAPLFIAQVEPIKLQVIRSTEKVLVPNRGAQLGNFGTNNVSELESWVTTSEGMAPLGAEKGGSNGSVYIARLLWSTPDPDWNKQ